MNVAHRLTDTITVQSQTGVSAGDPTWGSKVAKKGRVEHGTKMIVSEGTEKQSEAQVLTDFAIGLEDRVWFPGDDTSDDNAASRPIGVKKARDFGGYTIYETYF